MQINARRKHSSKIPRGLERVELPSEMSEMLQSEAIEVFTASVNAGRSFQHALLSVFLSGMSMASEAAK